MIKKNSVLVTVLTTAERDGWLSPHLLGFLMRPNGGMQRDVQLQLMHNIRPVDAARNQIADDLLCSDCEWLLMVDNDQVPPMNLLEMIDRAGDHMDVLVPKFYVTANVVQRGQQRLEPVLGWQPLNGKPVEPGTEWTQLSAASSGTMFVRRSAFEKLARPYFRFVYDQNGRVCECEDIFFSRKAQEAGLTIWGNQNHLVEHFKTIPLSVWAQSLEYRDLRGIAGRFPAVAA
jgi:GT2 family glycosyltransferase